MQNFVKDKSAHGQGNRVKTSFSFFVSSWTRRRLRDRMHLYCIL